MTWYRATLTSRIPGRANTLFLLKGQQVDRLPLIENKNLSPEQRRVYDALVDGPRGAAKGPWLAFLHVPEIADRVQHLSNYLRFESSFEQRLLEFVILITARHYNCEYEWYAHEPLAQKGGLPQSTIDAVKVRRHPENMQSDETTVFDYTTELLRNGKVSDIVYRHAVSVFGTKGVVELTTVIGFYIMIGMTLLAHEIAAPAGKPPLPK